jgi:hypothetical protein
VSLSTRQPYFAEAAIRTTQILRYFRFSLQLIGVAALLLAAAAGLSLSVLPNWLEYQDRPAKADYIFPLAGDNSRLLTAIDLYKKGYAPRILVDNERIRPESRFAKLMAEFGISSHRSARVAIAGVCA